MWEPRGLSLGEIGASQLVCTHSRCSPLKGGSSLGGPLILVTLVSGLHTDLDQLENKATLYFTLVATSESSFVLSFFLRSHQNDPLTTRTWEPFLGVSKVNVHVGVHLIDPACKWGERKAT